MPELPDLEVLKDSLNSRFGGKKITEVNLKRPEFLKTRFFPVEVFRNTTLVEVSRRGKVLIFSAQNGFKLVFHPMLRGWVLKQADDYILKFEFEDGSGLFFLEMEEVGLLQLYIVKKPENLRILKNLGPEPLTDDFGSQYFYEKAKSSRDSVKKLLTTQKIVAGIGNAYADEILWEARINPFKKSNTLSLNEVETLVKSTKLVLNEAIVTLKEVAAGDFPPFEYREHLKIHRRDGLPCPRCGTPIAVKFEGDRGTYWCPACQV